MANYKLESNEVHILTSERVLYGSAMASYANELHLTNLNIVLISKGAWGNVKDIRKFPLSQIKEFDGQVQAKLGKRRNGLPQLEIFFVNGHEVFGFEQKKEVQKWIEQISILITGNTPIKESADRITIPGTEFVAETLKGTFDTFKDVLGIQSKKAENNNIRTSIKCTSCMAPISGLKGQTVRCKYCDTEQSL